MNLKNIQGRKKTILKVSGKNSYTTYTLYSYTTYTLYETIFRYYFIKILRLVSFHLFEGNF